MYREPEKEIEEDVDEFQTNQIIKNFIGSREVFYKMRN